MRRRVAAAAAAALVAMLIPGVVSAQVPDSSDGAARASGDPANAPATPAQPDNLEPMSDGYGATGAQDAAMQAASATARKTSSPTVVSALTTPTQEVVAQPGGGFRLVENAQPVRTHRHGRWVPVDTSLHRTGGGRLSPAATAYGTVSFSGGGSGPLARSTAGGTTYAVWWNAPLPVPVVHASQATYRDVLPGVDLVVSATVSGGFSEVLVVGSAAAARNPALKKIRLRTRLSNGRDSRSPATDRVSVRSAHGGLSLDSTTPLMWDSTTAPSHHVASGAAVGGPDPSDAGHPGAAARIGPVAATVRPATLTLRPDASMLSAPSTVFPVYIDPTFNWHPTSANSPAFDEVKQGSPCNHVSFYNNTGSAGDYGRLGVGVNSWDSCLGIMRAFYQWSIPKVIWGAHINTATVEATEVYSAYCDTSATVTLHATGEIGSGTDWNNKPGYRSYKTGVSFGPSYNPDYCPNNDSVSHGFDVTSPISSRAANHTSVFTAALAEDSAEDNHNDAGFKRFSDNPALQIFYNRAPNTPGTNTLAATTGADNAGCDTTSPYPYIGKTIATNTPVLSAKVSDPDGDSLQATFHYWISVSNPTVHSGVSGDNLASGAKAKFSLPASFVNSLANGDTVGWHVQVSDGEDTSAWSATCHFTAEPTAPSQPTITSADGAYPDTDNDGGVGAAAGTTGSFTLTNTGTTATKFAYRLDQLPALTGTPASQLVTASGDTATVHLTPYTPGPHTLWVAAVDAAGDASSMAAYRFDADHTSGTTCASLIACYNNTAISPDTNMSLGGANGYSSYSATDLTNAGWDSGGTITIDGATFRLPTYGSGQADNVLAAHQTITYTYQVPSAGGSALTFLATSTDVNLTDPGAIDNDATAPYVPAEIGVSGTYCFDATDPAAYCPAEGTVTYTDGTTQTYYLTVPGWTTGPASLAAVSLPHQNKPSGQVTPDAADQPKIYPFSVPLAAGKTIASVTLPDVSTNAAGSTPSLHIFGMAPRNTTTATATADGSTTPAPAGTSWTGAWASPTEGSFNYQGANFNKQTFRVDLRPSVSGDTVRVKLDNALGTGALSIGHVTVAASYGPSYAVPDGPVHSLTFAGTQAVTIPEGGMVYSDPLNFTVTANQYLLVSFVISNSVAYLVEHSWAITADTHQFVTAIGSGDHTTDTTDTAFTGTGSFNGDFSNLLTDVDVTTSGTGTQAVLGDGLIDAWEPDTIPDGSTGLADDLAATQPTTPAGYGVVSEGIESNQIMTDFPESYGTSSVGGPAALSRIDRDILDQPGLTTVVLYEGLEDVLNGRAADDLTKNGYTELLSYLQASNITVIAMGLTPCDGYTGDGATGNSSNDPCTADVDDARLSVNDWLSSGPLNMAPWTTPAFYYLDPDTTLGVADASTGQIGLDPNADVGDHVNLTNPGYAALTTAYLSPHNTWPLDDGADDPTTTVAADTASNATNPYLADDPAAGTSPATLTGGATWTTDTTRGTVLTLDGTTGYATTTGPVVDTTGSVSISAWVNLATLPATDATIAAQNGTTASAITLQYNHTHSGSPGWAFTISATDTTNPTLTGAYASGAGTGWTHLVGVYNAATGTAMLYVNGTLAATATGATTFGATGPFTLGHQPTDTDYLPGALGTIQVFNYALTDNQVTALDQQIS